MVTPRTAISEDLKYALDRVSFARSLCFEPDGWQLEALITTSKRVLFNISRQAGKSTVASLLALHEAVHFPRSLVLVLAPSLRQSQELFNKILDFYKAGGLSVAANAERRLSLELANGSRILTLPGTEKTIRGFSGVSLLVIDEAARVEDGLYFALRPMLAVSGGSLLMLSTPAGRRGAFYEEWAFGEGWERYEVKATEVPRISAEFLETESRTLPSRIFRQEYMCSFEENEDAVFGEEDVRRAFTSEILPLEIPGSFSDQ